jgi:meso-butanediol dehydrogenase/(S,S)-butanediol dehydrogenase/diacetyl reductase
MKGLAGRHALITGAASGIGLATARRLAEEGCRVSGLDAEHSHDESGFVSFVCVDVADPDAIVESVATAREAGGPIDILVTAAGIDRCDTVPGTPIDEWRRLIDVDLNGVYFIAHAVLPQMIDARSGVIVTVSSAIGSVGHWNRSAYCAAKAGVENLTRAMALDHGAQGIRVNCVAPGLIDTPLIRGGKVGGEAQPEAMQGLVDRFHAIPRIGQPDEVAAAICFLASDDASFITGAILPVDAGWTAH